MPALDALADFVLDDVIAALSIGDDAKRRSALEEIADTLFTLAEEELAKEHSPDRASAFRTMMADNLSVTAATPADGDPEGRGRRIATVLAKAANGAAFVAAAEEDPQAKVTWITMLDDAVRDTHVPMHGITVAAGTPFTVGGYPLLYPGEPVGPPEIWMNCRCTLAVGEAALAAAAPPSGAVVVARPSDPESIAVEGGLPPDELHVTLGYYGDAASAPEGLRETLTEWIANSGLQAEAAVGGVARMGNDDPPAVALLLEHPALAEARQSLEAAALPDMTHPHFTPHITLGYGIEIPANMPTSVQLGELELWWGGDRGGVMQDDISPDISTTSATAGISLTMNSLVAVSDKPWSQFSAADYTIEQWRRACLLKMPGGDPESKSTYKLPVREPGGALNRNGVHAAAAALAGARGGTSAPAAAKNAAKSKLRGLYKQLGEDPPDSLAADAALVAVDTHDAPGWLTNPRETQRLRNYWTKGAGAAKIGWGSPGDLTRCASYIAKYVAPGYVWGTCNNLHYEAMGRFNPESGGRRGDGSTASDQLDAAFAAAAELEDDMELPPLEHFTSPGLTAATPYTVDPANENHVYGHLASWETCHVGREGCVPPPHSTHDYAYFSTGEVVTAGGPVPVGQITMNTGHATEDMDPRATVAHYDDTGTVVADVGVGEDDHGIWFNGELRPGITPEQRHALRAGALSGDWRRIGGNLELVAALAVNVPGFPIPREQLSVAASGAPMSLVAAAIVITDPNAELADTIAELVVGKIDGRKAAEARSVRAAALMEMDREARVERLLELVSG